MCVYFKSDSDSFLVCSVWHLQGEAVGFSVWRGDEVHLCKVLWLPAAAEGEQLYCLYGTSGVNGWKAHPGTRKLLKCYSNVLNVSRVFLWAVGPSQKCWVAERRDFLLKSSYIILEIHFLYYENVYTIPVCKYIQGHTLYYRYFFSKLKLWWYCG